MDLSKIEGLSEDQQAAIMAQFNTGIEGLKNKNSELINEKKNVQQANEEKEQALEDARKAALNAEEQRLKLAGDMDGLKTHFEQQLAEQTAKANEAAEKAQTALLSRDKQSVLGKALALIHDDFKAVSTPMLSSMIDISYNDKGEAVTSFKNNGEVIATDVSTFQSWAEKQDTFKNILNGVNSSGAGATQTGSASGKPLTLTEKAIMLNQNPNAKF
jgi:predicted nuclease with TOPRIM domain